MHGLGKLDFCKKNRIRNPLHSEKQEIENNRNILGNLIGNDRNI